MLVPSRCPDVPAVAAEEADVIKESGSVQSIEVAPESEAATSVIAEEEQFDPIQGMCPQGVLSQACSVLSARLSTRLALIKLVIGLLESAMSR